MSAFVLLYQRVCSKENRLLKRIWFTTTLRFHVTCWPIKFQIFCNRTINSRYIHALRHQTKTSLHSQRDIAVSRICEQMEEVAWARKLVSFEWGIIVCNSYFSLVLRLLLLVMVWCSDTNMYIKERMNCRGYRFYQKVTSGDSRIGLYWYPVFGQPESLLF